MCCAGNRIQSSERLTDERLRDKDSVRIRSASQNINTVHPECVPAMSDSKGVDMIPQMNGSIRPRGEDLASRVQWRDSVESSYTAETLRSTEQLESERHCQPALCHNSDRSSSSWDSQRSQASSRDGQKTSSADRCDYNCGSDTSMSGASASAEKSHEIHAQNGRHSSTETESFKLSSHDCRYAESTDSCSVRSEDADVPTSHKPNYLTSSQSTQKPVSDCDKVIVNGIGGSDPIIDDLSDNIPMDDEDGVVFDTSEFEIINANKSAMELPNSVLEFGEPVNCNDVLRWNVGSLDSPQQASDDKFADNLALPKHVTYTDENHCMTMEPNNGLLYSYECREAARISDSENRHLNQTPRPSNNIQPRVFSDISDDDDTGTADRELIPNCGTGTVNNQLLPKHDKTKLAEPPITDPLVTEDELMHSMEIDAANRYGNDMEYDDGCEDIIRQNSADKSYFSPHQYNDKSLSQGTVSEKACRGIKTMNSLMRNESHGAYLTNPNDATNLPTVNETESPACDSASALKKSTWEIVRTRRRRRSKFGNKTILDVVNMLLKNCGDPECSGQQTGLGTDAEEREDQHVETPDESTLSLELPAMCEDGPGSPMDEAPPLLAITDLLEDGTDGTEPIQTEKRASAATAGVGYDSDDTEAAMPVIEDMRPLLPKEDPLENEVSGNHEEVRNKARNVRKTSTPLKRAIPAAEKEVIEIERTRNLSVVCNQCTFSCGSERALHQHVKICHRLSARSNEQARYVCTMCPASTGDRESFLDHLAHHPGQHLVRYFACSHCGTDSVDMATMEEHVSSNHDGAVRRFEVVQERVTYLDNLITCPLCGDASKWKKNFVAHIRSYHQMEQLAAYLEHEYRDQRWPEKLSIRSSDVTGQAGVSGSQCKVSYSLSSIPRYRNLCESSSSFNSSRSVVVHICCRCTFSTDDINSYLEHYRGHFATSAPTRAAIIAETADREPRTDQRLLTDERLLQQPKGKTGGSYACHLCPFKTPKRMFYHRHMAIHERNSGMTDGYRCGYCQFAHPRVHCITFHLGRYHGNRPSKVIRISGGIESEMFDDGQDNEDTTASPASKPSTFTRNGYQPISSYDSCDSVSSFSSTATAFVSLVPVNQKTGRELANESVKRLNEFERRLPPSMFYEEPVKCPLCSFTNTVRINLLRHLRTHRNDDELDIANPVPADNVSGFAVDESWQNGTADAGGYRHKATEATAMNIHEARITATSNKPRMTQQFIENSLVNIIHVYYAYQFTYIHRVRKKKSLEYFRHNFIKY